MANPIDLIITQEALKVVDNAIAKVNLLDKTMQEATQHFIDNAKKMASATPSGVAGSAENNAATTAQLKAQSDAIAKLSTELANLNDRLVKLNATKQTNKKLTADEIVQNQAERKAAIELARVNSELIGSYDKLNIRHQQAVRNAQNLGVTYGTTSKQFKDAANSANILDKELKDIDKTLGKSQRNVGNYGNSFNALGSTLGALGITTGIAGVVALGTNIFNTTKEIISMDNALKLVTETQANFEIQQAFLTKTSEDFGVEIGSLTKQFTQFYVSAKDKLSGNEIQDIFRSITKAGSAMGLSTQNQERAFLALNQMMSKGTIQAEELRGQLGEALPGALGIMAKAVGVNEAELAKMMKAGQLLSADVLPKFAKQLEITYGIDNVNRIDNLSSAQTRLSNSWTNFVRSLDEDGNTLSKFFTKILGTLSEIVKGTTLIFQSETTKQQNTFKHLREKGYNETLEYYNSLDKLNKGDLEVNKAYMSQKILDAKKEVDIIRGRNLILKNLEGRRFGMSTDEQKRVVANESEKKANDIRLKDLANVTSSYLGQITAINSLLEPEKKHVAIIKEGNKEKEKKVKTIKLETVNQLELSKTEDTALERLKQLKKALEQTRDETSKNSTEFQQFEESIKGVNETIDFLTKGLQPIKLDIKVPFQEGKKDVDALKEATDNWLGSFSSEFLQNSGLGSLQTFFDGTFDKLLEGAETTEEKFAVTFNAIAESAQEAFNFISNASQQNFDNERKRIEDQQAIAISYAGGSSVAIAKINEDAEKRKKDIANRENKAKQKQAIFNIAIDTAQGIVSALASTPPNIPLSILIGALGAVQIGIVASQKIPQYWMGGTHDGGLMMVNDGNGSNFKETIVTPDGKIMKPQGRNVIMDAPAGTEIYTHDMWQDQLQNMLQGKGIEMNKSNQYHGITKNDMYEVMADTLGTQTQHYSNFDAEGATDYIIKGGNKTVINRNRGNGRGSKF